MKSLAILAAALTVAASTASAHTTKYVYGDGAHAGMIVVSCFRGPWEEVIWDRPEPVFIDSLVGVGYDFPTAHAISERVCRDKSLVNNPDGLRATMEGIYYSAPVSRR